MGAKRACIQIYHTVWKQNTWPRTRLTKLPKGRFRGSRTDTDFDPTYTSGKRARNGTQNRRKRWYRMVHGMLWNETTAKFRTTYVQAQSAYSQNGLGGACLNGKR